MAVTPRDTAARFAANLRAARKALELTQTDIARRMRGHGIPWVQNTVATVESGRRHVHLAEAEAAAQILGVPLDRMLTEPAARIAHAAKENNYGPVSIR